MKLIDFVIICLFYILTLSTTSVIGAEGCKGFSKVQANESETPNKYVLNFQSKFDNENSCLGNQSLVITGTNFSAIYSDQYEEIWESYWLNQIDMNKNLTIAFSYPSNPTWLMFNHSFVNLSWEPVSVSQSQKRDEFIDWVMDLYFITDDGVYRDVNNRIGVASTTSDGRDGLDADFFEPNVSEFGVLYFVHDEWYPPGKLDYDYRSNDWNEQLWKFQVWNNNVSGHGNWNLRWFNMNNVPGNIRLSLTQLDTTAILISDLALEREYSFSLQSGSMRDFVLKAVVIEDSVSPYMDASFVQNPVLEDYVDLYIFPSEPIGDLVVLVNSDSLVPGFRENNYNIYRTSFQVAEAGSYTIIYAAQDLAGNSGQDTLFMNFQHILAAGNVVSPDRKVELTSLPKNIVDDRQLLGLGYGWDNTGHPIPGELIGNIYTVFVSTLQSDEKVDIRFHLGLFGLRKSDYANLSIYQETAKGWEAVETILDIQNGIAKSYIGNGGRFALVRKGEDSPVESLLPSTTALQNSYPNPFNTTTVIPYTISVENWVSIIIYDLLGREIKVLKDEVQFPGRYRVVWRGKDNLEKPVSSGVYLIRFSSGNIKHTQKISLIK